MHVVRGWLLCEVMDWRRLPKSGALEQRRDWVTLSGLQGVCHLVAARL